LTSCGSFRHESIADCSAGLTGSYRARSLGPLLLPHGSRAKFSSRHPAAPPLRVSLHEDFKISPETACGLNRTLSDCYSTLLPFLGSAPEPFEVIERADEHREYWRPPHVRLVLLAESHVYTQAAELDHFLRPDPLLPPDLPKGYVRLVYALGYGEDRLLDRPIEGPRNSGTPQYLKLFFSCLNQIRANKGLEEAHQSINEYMPEDDRPIPFPNIIYIGDGMTDVPCMTVTKKNGDHAIAVFPLAKPKARRTCEKLLDAGRVDFIAPADYSSRKVLERRVQLTWT